MKKQSLWMPVLALALMAVCASEAYAQAEPTKRDTTSKIAPTPGLSKDQDQGMNKIMRAPAQRDTVAKGGTSNLSSWSDASKKAVEETRAKYGEPDEVTESMMVWHDAGPWKEIHVYKEGIAHDWPTPHMDVLKGTVDYQVPPDKFDDLALFDGSVTANRTKGTLSAMCDKEAHNFMAINLAHDIIKNARTWKEAREVLERTAASASKGDNSSAYLTKIGFDKMEGTMDRDRKASGAASTSLPANTTTPAPTDKAATTPNTTTKAVPTPAPATKSATKQPAAKAKTKTKTKSKSTESSGPGLH